MVFYRFNDSRHQKQPPAKVASSMVSDDEGVVMSAMRGRPGRAAQRMRQRLSAGRPACTRAAKIPAVGGALGEWRNTRRTNRNPRAMPGVGTARGPSMERAKRKVCRFPRRSDCV